MPCRWTPGKGKGRCIWTVTADHKCPGSEFRVGYVISMNPPEPMKRSILLLIAVLCATTLINAQTHFYIDEIAVTPAAPTTADNVSISLIGNLSDGGAYVQTAVADVGGGMVNITLVALSNGGITVLVPHTEVIELGQLPAGEYTIDFTDASTGILDGAPPAQHTFTVSGGGGSPCDGLNLLSVRWQAFSDTALVVHVENSAGETFPYPSFILFDPDGDTLAVESVFFFGIASESWHVLRIVDGATIPEVPFFGRLELWTNFTSELACVWQDTFVLCPPPPCAELRPTVANVSGMLVTGAFNWVVFDDAGMVGSGQFILGPGGQEADTALCLPPGEYHVNVSPVDPGFMGILYYYVTAPGGQSTPTMPVTSSLPVLLPFTFYGPCISGSQGISELAPSPLRTAPITGGLQVWNADGAPLGPLWLHDVQGRLIFNQTASTDRLFVPTPTPGVYVLRAGDHTVKLVAGLE